MEKIENRNKNKGTLVKILDYDPATHRVKVVRAKDERPLKPDSWSERRIEQQKIYEQKTSKVLKASDDPGASIIEVTEDMASLRGGSDTGFFSTKTNGNIIKGALSIEAEPHEIRVAGLYKMNPLLTSGFPSTIATPMPVFIFDVPGTQLVKQMAKDIAMLTPLLAMGAV